MGFKATMQGASDWLNAQDTGGFVKGPPMTQTALSHAITIKSQRGLKIGRIQSWAPNMSRAIDTVFEVQAGNTGEPIERVPQNQTTNSISVERYELYTAHMGEAFGVLQPANTTFVDRFNGGSDLETLIKQVNSFYVREIWRDPFGDIRAYVYVGCWFSSLGHTISATDDRVIKARATLEFTRRLRLA